MNHQDIYSVVRQVPRGRVATYGQIARLAGFPGRARQIGYALSALHPGSDVPWHRVVNAGGGISARSDPYSEGIQRDLLEQEGVVFEPTGRISLSRFHWRDDRDFIEDSKVEERSPAFLNRRRNA